MSTLYFCCLLSHLSLCVCLYSAHSLLFIPFCEFTSQQQVTQQAAQWGQERTAERIDFWNSLRKKKAWLDSSEYLGAKLHNPTTFTLVGTASTHGTYLPRTHFYNTYLPTTCGQERGRTWVLTTWWLPHSGAIPYPYAIPCIPMLCHIYRNDMLTTAVISTYIDTTWVCWMCSKVLSSK